MRQEKIKELLKCAHDFRINTLYWDHDRLTPEENDLRNYAAAWIKKTNELLKIIDAKTVVEIGSTRMELTQNCINYYDNCFTINQKDAPPCCQDGHSTYFWAREGYETHTVDIDPRCIEMLEAQYKYHIQEPIPDNLHMHIPQDGIEFLKNFDGAIDFLFLDGWDKGTDMYAERHLEAFQAAENKMSDLSLVSIDDTDFSTESGGKDNLLSPYLLDNGYIKILWGRQTVFVKA